MSSDEKWYFTEEQLANTPSRKCGIDAAMELKYRQQAANFIQDMGQRLSVTQLCINTAIVYMHRFYMFHSFSRFHRNSIATAALFLAAKVEEQPRRLEHIIKVASICFHAEHQQFPDMRSEQYLEQLQDVVFNESVLLQTLGFDFAIDHPHTHIVRCCHLIKASKDLAQASYFTASNSLHLTTMCLQYTPTLVACFCIHLACKRSNWEIPPSSEGKPWFWYVDDSITAEQLEHLTSEFLHTFDHCQAKFKQGIKSETARQSPSLNHPSLTNSPDYDPRQVNSSNDSGPTKQTHPFSTEEPKKPPVQTSSSSSTSSRPFVDYRENKEPEHLKGVTNGTRTSAENIVKPHNSHSLDVKQQTGAAGAMLISHHNHYGPHRNDGKPQQTLLARASSVSASSESARPRLPQDDNAPTTSGNTAYHHSHQTKKNTDPAGISYISILKPPIFDPNHSIAEEPINFNRLEAKHEKSANRGYDSRHKIPEDSVKVSEAKMYAKCQREQLQQQQRGRKIVDSIEQKKDEIRKFIERPLPLPKAATRTEITSQNDDFQANMLKQSHNTKYGQGELMWPTTTPFGGFTTNLQDFGSTAKIVTIGRYSQYPIGGSEYDNTTVMNGNSVVNGESKTKNCPRYQLDDNRLQGTIINQQQQRQHKSVFSPKKALNSQESHTLISFSSTQKTQPSTENLTNLASTGIAKSFNELFLDQANYDNTGKFENSLIRQTVVNHQSVPHHHSQAQNSQEMSRSYGERQRTSSIGDSSRQSLKMEVNIEQGMEMEGGIKIEQNKNWENYESKTHGRAPELIQPIRYNPTSANGQVGAHSAMSSGSNDLKPPEIIEPFETELITRQPHLTNNLNLMITREEGSEIETGDSGVSSLMWRSSQDYLSPVKSAQSINALLLEPFAPMPSLLQEIGDYNLQQTTSQAQNTVFDGGRSYQYGDTLDSWIRDNRQQNIAGTYPQLSQSIGTAVKIEKAVLSTVDMSALAVPQQMIPGTNPIASVKQTANPCQNPQNIVQTIPTSTGDIIIPCLRAPTSTHATGTTATTATLMSTSAQISKHHKSDKKKKKKGKHKEKSRDKKKRKHKDKVNEKQKNINITISKDKLNLTCKNGTTTTTQFPISNPRATNEKKSPEAGLKIKIPKKKLKITEPKSQTLIQAPLKIQIRTNGGSVVGESSENGVSVSTNSRRKRGRALIEASGNASLVVPPTKKQNSHHPQGVTTTTPTEWQIQGTATTYSQQQSSQPQQGQKQNGRHYWSNNKKKHSSSHAKTSNKLSQ